MTRTVHGSSRALCGVPLILCVALPTLLAGCHQRQKIGSDRITIEGPIRAMWVTRWDFKTPHDIVKIMDNCRAGGFNTVLFQVRGNGTALYRSRIEPWADELGGRDPGFDPLAVACREAHQRKMQLHAWVNVMPGWRGKKPPANPRQLYNARPDWFWRDAAGRRQPLGWYNSLNPCYPEVRRYLTDVMGEIVANYPVDGLHMDYVRFPNEWNSSYPEGANVPDYPRDRRTLAMFRKATGKHPDRDVRAWEQWRTDQVTQLVRAIRARVKQEDPKVVLSAAVGVSPGRAKRAHFQDAAQWLAENLLDAVYPMNYDASSGGFEQNLYTWGSMHTRVPVVTGVMFDKRPSRTVIQQVDMATGRASHFAAFAYNSMFERLGANGRAQRDEQSASRAELRRNVIPRLRRLASASADKAVRLSRR